jgi:hypothetical protein
MKRFHVHLALLPTIALSLASCGAAGHIDVAVSSNAGPIPDARGAISHLYVVVHRVDVREKNENAINVTMSRTDRPEPADEATDPGESEAIWFTVFQGATRLDLLNMASAPAFLAGLDLPPGEIDQVRLVLAADAQMIIGAELVTVNCPSCTESGIKITIPNGVELRSGDSLDLTLDFTRTLDADHERLDPVIRAYATHQ